MKMATKSAKNINIGTATGRRRDRQSARGSPNATMTSGRKNSTPSVSPTHQVNQLRPKSVNETAPTAPRPASASVALMTQSTGEMMKKRARSPPLSSAVG